ncbi:Uncharacterized protein TCM_040413 [Theobroma cacao]|uniref:Uncharacterized protein n=1 Tax=Theobroma cacao TaxID=3641 RepID=A0A061GSJ5_THECC|nr:Uncharacterized protein TCM_040413 [Theobroma cacao]
MRIRKRLPSFPTIPSSVDSSEDVPSQKEEMEVSSLPAPGDRTAREAPEEVDTEWQSIMTRAHRLLGCSSYGSNHTIQSHVQEEHSSTNPVNNGEIGIEIQSTNGRNKKRLLEQENPRQTMAIEQGGGNARKQISNLFSNSQMMGNCSGTTICNTKGTTVSSSSCQGDAKRIFLGNSKHEGAETTMRTGGGRWKEWTDNLMAGSPRLACPKGSGGYQDEGEEDEEYSSGPIKKKVKTRKLTSIYADIRSLMPSSSKVNESEEADGKSSGED